MLEPWAFLHLGSETIGTDTCMSTLDSDPPEESVPNPGNYEQKKGEEQSEKGLVASKLPNHW